MKGLTQEQLAVAIGMDRGELSRVERGIRPLTSTKLTQIARVLRCSSRELAAQLEKLAHG